MSTVYCSAQRLDRNENYRFNASILNSIHYIINKTMNGEARSIKEQLSYLAKRLRVLEGQIVFFGNGHVPSHIVVERDDLITDIERLQTRLNDIGDDSTQYENDETFAFKDRFESRIAYALNISDSLENEIDELRDRVIDYKRYLRYKKETNLSINKNRIHMYENKIYSSLPKILREDDEEIRTRIISDKIQDLETQIASMSMKLDYFRNRIDFENEVLQSKSNDGDMLYRHARNLTFNWMQNKKVSSALKGAIRDDIKYYLNMARSLDFDDSELDALFMKLRNITTQRKYKE